VPNNPIGPKELRKWTIGLIAFSVSSKLCNSGTLHMSKIAKGTVILAVSVVASTNDAEITLCLSDLRSFTGFFRRRDRRSENLLPLLHHL
jgi:hypothetical protein